jgi:hypothetical protein
MNAAAFCLGVSGVVSLLIRKIIDRRRFVGHVSVPALGDGGQPMAVELDSGMVGVLCYLAPGATNGDSGVEPGIYWITFDPAGIV